MKDLLKNGYRAKLRPSGHDISKKFSVDNGAAIPPNLLAIAHTESNSYYLRYCKVHGIEPHPARFPAELPEFFIRMLTDPDDLIVDPFAGSCVTGEVAERLKRRWLCVELLEPYLKGGRGRFQGPQNLFPVSTRRGSAQPVEMCPECGRPTTEEFYRAHHPAALWNGTQDDPLPLDGGRTRPRRTATAPKARNQARRRLAVASQA
jgi:site-specific DNA-methyltransferase (cytosine-N4-specific)